MTRKQKTKKVLKKTGNKKSLKSDKHNKSVNKPGMVKTAKKFDYEDEETVGFEVIGNTKYTVIDNIRGVTEKQRQEMKDFMDDTVPLKPVGICVDCRMLNSD